MKKKKVIQKFKSLIQSDRVKTMVCISQLSVDVFETHEQDNSKVREAVDNINKGYVLCRISTLFSPLSAFDFANNYTIYYGTGENGNDPQVNSLSFPAAYAAFYAAYAGFYEAEGYHAENTLRFAIKCGVSKKRIYDYMDSL